MTNSQNKGYRLYDFNDSLDLTLGNVAINAIDKDMHNIEQTVANNSKNTDAAVAELNTRVSAVESMMPPSKGKIIKVSGMGPHLGSSDWLGTDTSIEFTVRGSSPVFGIELDNPPQSVTLGSGVGEGTYYVYFENGIRYLSSHVTWSSPTNLTNRNLRFVNISGPTHTEIIIKVL